ncbi:hypothetical protein [Haloechinothrix salitolerans]|uniref:DUF3156 domain-containing protein n=1 Tax=Haloechinothrix salitolerans TaxID=926830 RepID=A0ABW2C7F9_9PSEU
MSARLTTRGQTSPAATRVSAPVRAAAGRGSASARATAAARYLEQQADPFLRAGLQVADRGDDWLALTGDDVAVTVTLRWRTQRLLLARIHQLQVTADVDAASATDIARSRAPGAATSELRLRVSGPAGARSFRWQPRRGTRPAGFGGYAVADMARTVDLTSCTVTSRPDGWRVCVEPYAASRLRVFFPPIHYATTVRPDEAATIVAAVRALSAALT